MHKRNLAKIPLVISVTGTRGKTSTVRYLASIFRVSGIRVLAKTTGSEAAYILPGGTEIPVIRKGSANILEQKSLVRKAAHEKVDILIAEVMSIQPETHFAESQRLLQPHKTVLCNMRPDHLIQPYDDLHSQFINDLNEGSELYVPDSEMDDVLAAYCKRLNIKVNACCLNPASNPNSILAAQVAKDFGLRDELIEKGIAEAEMDIGLVSASKLFIDGRKGVFVNLFAANDPKSSLQTIEQILANPEWVDYEKAALLLLRKDRAERTVQWIEYLNSEQAYGFDKLFVKGFHGKAMLRQLKRGVLLKSDDPVSLTNEVMNKSRKPVLVFGLMNIAGLGIELCEFWQDYGEEYDLKL